MSLPKIIQKILNNYGYGTNLTGNDNDVVHKSGNEEINGNKTFSNSIITASRFVVASPDFTKGTLPSNIIYDCVYFGDKNARGDFKDCIGSVESSLGPTGIVSTWLKVRKNVPRESSSELEDSLMGVHYDSNTSEFYATAPSTLTTRNFDWDILTRDWIPKDTRIVHTSMNETIDGEKTFLKRILASDIFTGGSFIKQHEDVVKGTIPTNGIIYYWTVNFSDKNGTSWEDHCIGQFETALGSNNIASTYMRAMKNEAGSSANCTISCIYDTNNNVTLTHAPTPPENDNSTQIANTYWVRNFHGASSSDERLKSEINEIPDEVLDAWGDVSFCQFKFKNAINEKGNNARLHNGLVAQNLDRVFKDKNLDISKYGLFVHEEWIKEDEITDGKGNSLHEGRDAGEEYSLRYTEALCMEAAYNRRRVSRVEERLLALEQELAELKKNS